MTNSRMKICPLGEYKDYVDLSMKKKNYISTYTDFKEYLPMG